MPEREDLDLLGLAEEASSAIRAGEGIDIERQIVNKHRAIGGVVSHEMVTAHGPAGLPDDTIRIRLDGAAGQSLGAWLAAGISIDLRGEAITSARDYRAASSRSARPKPPPTRRRRT